LLPDLRGPALPRRTSQRPTRRGRRCGHDNKGKQEPRLQTGNPAGSSQRLDPKVTHVTRNRGKVKKRYRPELDFFAGLVAVRHFCGKAWRGSGLRALRHKNIKMAALAISKVR